MINNFLIYRMPLLYKSIQGGFYCFGIAFICYRRGLSWLRLPPVASDFAIMTSCHALL